LFPKLINKPSFLLFNQQFILNTVKKKVNQYPMDKTLNRLIKETSPYLLQHANNPVDWYPWGDEAFKKAEKENKLLLISIGYSSCHWCHVMEKEAFSNPEVAEYMNSHYISIKVDREERPDIDQIYMNAVQIITRRGGWPLNCFALPNGKPVFGGTYFKTEDWLNVIKNLDSAWKSEPNRIIDVANELTQSIQGSEIISFKQEISEISNQLLDNYSNRLEKLFDNRNGGITGAPKFPMPGLFEFLLEYGFHSNNDSLNNFVHQTLTKIASGGIYDHIGGGFSRYTVDENWRIPHFEKMLYDNAQLITLYSKAYRANPDETYKKIVLESIDFLISEMRSEKGGFFSSFDADSEGKEGAFYTWTKNELESILGVDAELFSVTYGVSASGNFDGTNVLYKCASNENIKELFTLDCNTIERKLAAARIKLKEARNQRVKPALDDKVILSWNAMVIDALVEAYITFEDKSYLNYAFECINYIESNHYSSGKLMRIYCKGKLSINALLDGYAYLIKAYLALYRVTINHSWIDKAKQLIDTAIVDFYSKESGMFYYASNMQNDLIARKMDLTDGVITSSNSVMAQNLKYIGELLSDEKYISMSNQMLANIANSLENGGPYVFGWARLLLFNQLPAVQLKVASEKSIEYIHSIQKKVIHPFIFPIVSNKISSDNTTIVHICIGKSCYPSSSESEYYIDLINTTRI